MPQSRMPQINQVALSGRLTRDPEAQPTETDRFRATFTMALNRNYTDPQGNWQKDTTDVPVWVQGKLAEITIERLRKSQSVFITGRLESRETALGVTARHIQFLDQKQGENPHEDHRKSPRNPSAPSGCL